MSDRTFRAEIGPYWISLPRSAHISAHVQEPTPDFFQSAATKWVVRLGRFQLIVHLDPINDLTDLKSFIDFTTKANVSTRPIDVNGIQGVTYGDYGPDRTWIDWWFKKGGTMICLCLQSETFPLAKPSASEIAEHNAIVGSLKYCSDFPLEHPPAPE